MGMEPFYLPLLIILLFVIMSKLWTGDTFCSSHPYSEDKSDSACDRASMGMEEKGDSVETRLLAYEHATAVSEIAGWTNDLIGKEVPGNPGYIVVGVVQFQLLNNQGSYDAMILVEVTEKQFEAQITLREADVEVI